LNPDSIVNQLTSIKTDLYSAVCRKQIRGQLGMRSACRRCSFLSLQHNHSSGRPPPKSLSATVAFHFDWQTDW